MMMMMSFGTDTLYADVYWHWNFICCMPDNSRCSRMGRRLTVLLHEHKLQIPDCFVRGKSYRKSIVLLCSFPFVLAFDHSTQRLPWPQMFPLQICIRLASYQVLSDYSCLQSLHVLHIWLCARTRAWQGTRVMIMMMFIGTETLVSLLVSERCTLHANWT